MGVSKLRGFFVSVNILKSASKILHFLRSGALKCARMRENARSYTKMHVKQSKNGCGYIEIREGNATESARKSTVAKP